MAYLDIDCVNCGLFHLNGTKPTTCPFCASPQIVAMPHNYDIDQRFRQERENMLARMEE